MDGLFHDLRFAVSSLRAARWTAVVAVLTIGLGTGVNTAVVAVAYGVLLRPLPYAEPSRLAILSNGDGTDLTVRLDSVGEWQSRLRALGPVGAYSSGDFTMRGAGEPTTVHAAVVTHQFFDALGVRPQYGQSFVSDASSQVVVSARLARQLAGGGAVGRALTTAITIGQEAYSVAAVMPDGFAFPSEQVDLWIPARSIEGVRMFASSDVRQFSLVGRLASGVTLPQAQEDVRRVHVEIEPRVAGAANLRQATIRPLTEAVFGRVRPVLQAFVGAAVLVLLVACANVASLLVGRFVAREREQAIRLAIGANVARLVRTALVESLVLAIAGSLFGLAIAAVLVRLFTRMAAGVLPRLGDVTLDWPVLLAAVAVTAAVALVCGIGPALSAARTDFAPAFRQTGSSTTRGTRRVRAALVAAQIALSIVLLTGAGLLTRTVFRLLSDDAGIHVDRALTMKMMLLEGTRFDAASRAPFVEELLARVRALPGVQSAGVGSNLPPRVAQLQFSVRFTNSDGTRNDLFRLNLGSVTPGYLESLGTRLIRGRLFEAADLVTDAPIVIISETAARQFSPGQDLLGRELPFGLPRADGRRVRPRVIGIVADVKFKGLEEPAGGALYLPWKDLPAGVSYLVVRTHGRPSAVGPGLRDILRGLDASMPVPAMRTLAEEVSESIAERRLRVVPAIAFAVLALAVALVGLAGSLTRAVAERRRELAIRAAVGASPRQAVWLIVRDGALVSLVGVVAGVGGSAAVGRALARLLYGVSPYDPLTFAGVVVLMGIASVAACYLPARRAARVEPLELLRES